MGKQELDNLVKIGNLKVETASRKEFDGMVKSARRGLVDAQNKSIDTDSQFDLAVEIGPQICARSAAAPRLPIRKPNHGISGARSHFGYR